METLPTDLIPQVTEAVAETIAQVTEPVTEAIEYGTEAVQSADYIPYLEALTQYANWQTSFMLFLVIVVLCYFVYKFFRIFF